MVKRMVIGGQFTAGMASWAIVIFLLSISIALMTPLPRMLCACAAAGLLVHHHTGVRVGGLGGEHRAREQGEQGYFR